MGWLLLTLLEVTGLVDRASLTCANKIYEIKTKNKEDVTSTKMYNVLVSLIGLYHLPSQNVRKLAAYLYSTSHMRFKLEFFAKSYYAKFTMY